MHGNETPSYPCLLYSAVFQLFFTILPPPSAAVTSKISVGTEGYDCAPQQNPTATQMR